MGSALATFGDARSLAALHACRSQDELERRVADGLRTLLGGVSAAFVLSDRNDGAGTVRFVIGDDCALREFESVDQRAWPVPQEQRMPVHYRNLVLGELLLGSPVAAELQRTLDDVLEHFGTALVNLVLNAESRQATDDYCASLQTLQEGIVLFQEQDKEAVSARLLDLVKGMMEATAGALFVLREIGVPSSGLQLEQVLGIPEALLESFRAVDGGQWPEQLLDWQAQVVERDDDGNIAGLAGDSVPPILERVAVLPLRYHGVQAGVCVLFNPLGDGRQTRNNIGRLQSFGQLAAALLHRLELERVSQESVSIQRELQLAGTIQQRLVPSEALPSDGFEFAWRSIAAKSIGGDCVDFLQSDLGDIYAIIADASGHGINSALLMTSFRANYRGNAPWLEPRELAASLNSEIAHEVGPTGMFITSVMARIEQDSGALTLCSAGHNPTMIFRAATGTIEQVESHGPPMGFLAGTSYEQYEGLLAAGDVLLMYTDGVTEAAAADGEMFGEERLAAVLMQYATESASAVLEVTLTQLVQFTGRECHDDDVSMLVIRAR
ncbi:MAG: PP2C family protein-serine/threonine phosphatase [Planctomycetota bacterium]